MFDRFIGWKNAGLLLFSVMVFLFLMSPHAGATVLFAPLQFISIDDHPSLAATGDLNRDGKEDLILYDYEGTPGLTVMLGHGDITFTPLDPIPLEETPSPLALADFNGDGNLDLVYANAYQIPPYIPPVFTVRMGKGDGTFGVPLDYPYPDLGDWQFFYKPGMVVNLRAIDLNGDGRDDLVTFHQAVGTFVYLANPDGTLRNPVSYSSFFGDTVSHQVLDINGDGKLDLVVSNISFSGSPPSGIYVNYGNGDGTFSQLQTFTTDASAVRAVDYNGDGRDDVLTWNPEGLNVSDRHLNVYLRNADGTLQAPVTSVPPLPDITGQDAVDFDRDGKSDFYGQVYQFNRKYLRVYPQRTDGTFHPSADFVLRSEESPYPFPYYSVHPVDLNGDGWVDLIVSGYDGKLGVLLNRSAPSAPSLHLRKIDAVDLQYFASLDESAFDLLLPASVNPKSSKVEITSIDIPDGTRVHLFRDGIEIGSGVLNQDRATVDLTLLPNPIQGPIKTTTLDATADLGSGVKAHPLQVKSERAGYDSTDPRGGTTVSLVQRNTPGFSGDGGLAIDAGLNEIAALAVDRVGNLFITDSGNYRIRKVGTDGLITTVAGSGPVEHPGGCGCGGLTPGQYSGDFGLATEARLKGPGGIAVDANGNLYIADTLSHRIRRVGTDGIITTIAGSGEVGGPEDGGLAVRAKLYLPDKLAIDSQGNLFFSDYADEHPNPDRYYTGSHQMIREISPDGIIRTIAGGGENFGNLSTTNPAQQAQLSGIESLSFDQTGNLLIGQFFSPLLQLNLSTGTISYFSWPGVTPGNVNTNGPTLMDATGNLYGSQALTSDKNVWKEGPGGVHTFIARKDMLDRILDPAHPGLSPSQIALDSEGNFYYQDGANTVRKIYNGAGPAMPVGVAYSGPHVQLGDLDENGKINIADTLLSLQIAIGAHPPIAQNDVNKDGAQNVLDTRYILQAAISNTSL